jgi:hypothetical protein
MAVIESTSGEAAGKGYHLHYKKNPKSVMSGKVIAG